MQEFFPFYSKSEGKKVSDDNNLPPGGLPLSDNIVNLEKMEQEGWAGDREVDCPICGDSGSCYVCDRGRREAEHFKEEARENKKNRGGNRPADKRKIS